MQEIKLDHICLWVGDLRNCHVSSSEPRPSTIVGQRKENLHWGSWFPLKENNMVIYGSYMCPWERAFSKYELRPKGFLCVQKQAFPSIQEIWILTFLGVLGVPFLCKTKQQTKVKLSTGQFWLSRDIWQCLTIFLIITDGNQRNTINNLDDSPIKNYSEVVWWQLEGRMHFPNHQVVAPVPKKIFIQWHDSSDTYYQFQIKFPVELENRVDREKFKETVQTLHKLRAEAEKLGGQSYLEGCLACLAAYTIFLCMKTHYEKVLKKISKYIQEKTKKIYDSPNLLLTYLESGLQILLDWNDHLWW